MIELAKVDGNENKMVLIITPKKPNGYVIHSLSSYMLMMIS